MADNSGIFEELHAERQELERMLKTAKNIITEEIVLSASPFFSLEEKEGKLLITGIALAEGVWKSVLYPAEEIEKSALRLVGKPLKIEHGLDALFEQREVGKVKVAYYDKALKSIVFQAEVTDSEAIALVKDGTFPAVSCFAKGTKIFSKFDISNIEDDPHALGRGLKETVILKIRFLPEIHVTKDHLVLVTKGKSFSKWNPSLKQVKRVTELSSPVWTKIGQLKSGDFLCIPKETFKMNDLYSNHELAVIAWYISEGWISTVTRSERTYFSLGFNEPENVLALKTHLQTLGYHVGQYDKSTSRCLYVTSKKLASFLRPFGTSCYEKRLTKELFELPPEKKIFFLSELVKGDGYRYSNPQTREKNGYSFVSTSEHLIFQIWILLKSIGTLGSISVSKPRPWKIEGRTGIGRTSWNLRWVFPRKESRFREDAKYFYIPITKIQTGEREEVFDLLDTPNHIFKVPFIVHNCSTWVDKFPVNPDQSIGFNFNFNELSLVRTPACEKCVLPETLILGEGLSEIGSGPKNSLLSSKGRKQKILGFSRRPYLGPLLKIKTRGKDELGITPEHKMLIRRPRKIYLGRPDFTRGFDPISWMPASKIRKFDQLIVPKLDIEAKEHKLPCDPEFLGWFIAEGNIRQGRSIKVGQKNLLALSRIRMLSPKPDAPLRQDRQGFWFFEIHDRKLAFALQEFFRGRDKFLPNWFLHLPKEQLAKFLCGYLRGDGCLEKGRIISCSSKSKELINSLRFILLRFDVFPYLYFQRQKHEWKRWSWISRMWTLKLNPVFSKRLNEAIGLDWPVKESNKMKMQEDRSYFYLPVSRVKKMEYKGFVFNFETEDKTFLVPYIVHNCFIFAVEELSKKVNQEKQSLNNQSSLLIKQEVKETMTEENEEVIEELEEEEIDLSEMEQPKLYAVVEVDALTDFDETLAKKVISYYYGYNYPYGYKGKYPYPGYPYYPYYPYYGKYPAKQTKDKKYYEEYPYKKPEKKSLWALLELESPEEIEALKKRGKKVKAVYYGYYGYPHKGYPYKGYPYPYKGYPYKGYPYRGYPYKEKKSEEYKCPEGQVWDEKTGKCVEEMTKKEEYKCPEGQVWDEKTGKCIEAPKEMAKGYKCPEGQEWDEKEKKCVEAKEKMSDEEELLEDLALPKEYLAFMKKCMKERKTMPVIKRMKECAKAFKAQKPEEKAAEYKCPEGEVFDEKEKKCVPAEKKEAYPTPEKQSSREFTDMKPGVIEVTPGPAEQAATIAAKEKLSAETVKKEEAPIIPKVESPMAEEPCKECPEKEKASAPKVEKVKPVESPKVEAPKEGPKVEPPKVEPPKEEPKVETPKVEEKPVPKSAEVKPEESKKEETKEPTKEEIEKYVKEHYPEIILKLRKEKKFP